MSTPTGAAPAGTTARAAGEWHASRGLMLAGGIVAAVLVGLAAPGLTRDWLGIPATTVVLSQTPVATALVLLGAFAALTVIAAFVARSLNAVVGLFVLGVGVMALSMGGGSVPDAVFAGASLRAVGIETMAWGLVTCAAAVTLFRVAGPLLDIPPRDGDAPWWREYFDAEALRGAVAGLLLPVLAWVVVRTMMKGQAIGGAFLGGIAAGIGFRLLAHAVQPVLAFAAPVLLAGAVQAITAPTVHAQVDGAFVAGSLSPITRMMPLDVVGGALVGVAIGIGWARSFKRSDTMHS